MPEQPLYRTIYQQLRADISAERYCAGDILPTEQQLCELFQVSRITSKKALNLLADEGLVKRYAGKGSVVIKQPTSEPASQTAVEFQSSKTNQTKPLLLGVILSDFTEYYGVRLLAAMEKKAREGGAYIIPARSLSLQQTEGRIIREMQQLGVGGFIIMAAHGENYSPEILKLVVDGVPLVFVDRLLKGIPASFVGTDNRSAAKEATRRLFQRGCQHIVYLSQSVADTSALEDRLDGFLAACGERNQDMSQVIVMDDIEQSIPSMRGQAAFLNDVARIKTLLEANPQIDGIFAAEYEAGLSAVQALREMGESALSRFQLAAFDGPEKSLYPQNYIHIWQNTDEMGQQAVRMLLEHMSGSQKRETLLLDARVKG